MDGLGMEVLPILLQHDTLIAFGAADNWFLRRYKQRTKELPFSLSHTWDESEPRPVHHVATPTNTR